MRWRTAGSSAKRTSSWISFLPPSSAGCALPAMISCTGRSGWSSRRLSRSGSRSIRVSRLYDGTRRAKPMVSTSGSSASSTQLSSAAAIPRCRLDLRSRRRASCTSRSRSSRLTAQMSPAGAWSTALQKESVSSRLAGSAVPGGEVEDLATDPGRGVHAVGDRGDRHLGLVERRPQAVEHLPAHVAVQLRDAVGALAQTEAHHGHVEHRRVAAGVVLGAQGEDPVDRYAGQRAGRPEVLLDRARGRSGRCRRAPGCGS